MPKQVDHDIYRKELLAKSFECFAARGYGSVTMRELAKSLNVSTGTLYHYFPGKQELFNELVDFLGDIDVVKASGLMSDHGSLAERIETLLAFVSDNQEWYLKQTLVWLDYLRQHGKAVAMTNPAVVRSNELYRFWIASYLGINDPVILSFTASFLNGVLIELAFEAPRDSFRQEAELLARVIEGGVTKDSIKGG